MRMHAPIPEMPPNSPPRNRAAFWICLGAAQIRLTSHLMNGMAVGGVPDLASCRVFPAMPRCLDSETQAHLRAPEVFGVLAKVAV